MSSEIFNCLLREKAEVFRAAFSTVSTEVFYDPETRRLRHAGEYGTYRESIVRDFLRFVVPRALDVSTGFIITAMDDVSTQCDIVIFDSKMTPLYEEGDRQRFFPVESVFCVGEVKSTLSKAQLGVALNKLAAVKALGERIQSPTILRKQTLGAFSPAHHPYDLVPSILICSKLDFDLTKIENELDSLYDGHVEPRHRHNLVLSLEDGIFTYVIDDKLSLPYPILNGKNLKHRVSWPGENKFAHLQLFASCMFSLTANKTLLYPEISDYIGPIPGAFRRDQA